MRRALVPQGRGLFSRVQPGFRSADDWCMVDRSRLLRHLGLPVVLALAFLGLYHLPVSIVGCVNRGLLALGLVALSIFASLVAMGLGIRVGRSRDESVPWFLTAVALLLPALVVVSVEIVLTTS